ncbi:Cytochrome c [Polystyrenella longa]|uniref:Cytochrome c n=1 Tax=Polystyrenella longa TaxID=2528007 RepID=A0A518CJA6_9PLAN|nr:PVC-type heme-binding CxxCH protein [Polystyrenella longa]QDU79312.1 Cytochrome c [Polystyrenella longa]
MRPTLNPALSIGLLRSLCTLCLFALLALPLVAQDSEPLPPEEAAEKMSVPEGFNVSLFAAEPDVVQPIAFTIDHRGRLWVVECLSYPEWSDKKQDRIVILEDTDGDGTFDDRKVFWDQGVNLSGIEVGFGGVWVCSTPNFLFIADADQNDEPDGEPVVLLDGWDAKSSRHNVFNGLTWGPDGWLYGLNGILSKSLVGKPGTPETKRDQLDCGVWRYHPTKQEFEVVAHGTTNPWGLDFDQYGQMFITNCVIKHLWHIVPGAHYERMFGVDVTPHTYELIESVADHIHWGGGNWTSSRDGEGKHDSAGGGHAHAGAMVYQGDNWPEEYRNKLYTLNIHGRRANQDILEPEGSTYSAHHGEDMLFSGDPWFRGLELKYGPDGAVYITDWNDTGECHDYINTQKQTGRIFKVSYGDLKSEPVNLSEKTDAELVELHTRPNNWYAQHARQLLQERAALGELSSQAEIIEALWNQFHESTAVPMKLRSLWTIHVLGGVNDQKITELLRSPEEWLRSWAIRLAMDDRYVTSDLLSRFIQLAEQEESPRVRLELASALQRMPRPYRWMIAPYLLNRAQDQEDPYLPLMIWYGINEAIEQYPQQGVDLISLTELPQVRELIARQLANEPALYEKLANSSYDIVRLDLLRGIQTALLGQKQVEKPAAWDQVRKRMATSNNPEIELLTTLLSLQFGIPEAAGELRTLISNQEQPQENRETALTALTLQQNPELVAVLLQLLDEETMRGPALVSLAAFENEAIPSEILSRFTKMPLVDQQKAIGTLTSRPDYALKLLDAMEKEEIERNALSAFYVRQILSHKQENLTKRLEEVWGTIGQTDEAKQEQIDSLTKLFTADNISNADASHGRLLFKLNCANCHQLFGEGSKVGPELTGSQRRNSEYLIQNMVTPNALVGKDFQMTTFSTTEGRVVSGIIISEENDIITLQTPTEKLTLSTEDVEDRKTSSLSLMPEGLLKSLSEQDTLDLVSYLQSENQVPLPEGAASEPAAE